MRQSLESGLVLAVIFLNLIKAFDCLTHEILIDKLSHHGACSEQLSWFSSCLTGRSIATEASDDQVSVPYWVPKGLILGPSQLLIYVHDIYRLFTATRPNLCCRLCQKYDSQIAPIAASNKHEELSTFDDESTLGASATDQESFILKLQTVTEKIYQWFNSNPLAMNVKKSYLFSWSHKGKSCLTGIELPASRVPIYAAHLTNTCDSLDFFEWKSKIQVAYLTDKSQGFERT